MTREEVRDKLTRIFSGREHFDGEVYITEAMQLIDSWVGEIIGEDSNISYHIENGIRYLHHDARESMRWEEGYNKAKSEARARAGLSTKGGKEK